MSAIVCLMPVLGTIYLIYICVAIAAECSLYLYAKMPNICIDSCMNAMLLILNLSFTIIGKMAVNCSTCFSFVQAGSDYSSLLRQFPISGYWVCSLLELWVFVYKCFLWLYHNLQCVADVIK